MLDRQSTTRWPAACSESDIGKVALPERRQLADLRQLHCHGQPVRRNRVAEAEGAPQTGDDDDGVVRLALLGGSEVLVAQGVVQHTGVDAVGRGAGLCFQHGISCHLGRQRRADAQDSVCVRAAAGLGQGRKYQFPRVVERGEMQPGRGRTTGPETAGVLPSEGGSRISTN